MKNLLNKLAAISLLLVALVGGQGNAAAVTGAYPAETKNGSIGMEGRISAPPPKQGATISSPGNGATFTSLPVTVTGICPDKLLVKVFSNNVFVGSVLCAGGSYSVQIDLFAGSNELVARVYDELDQAGPDSNKVTVTYVSAQFAVPGSQLTMTSDFARKGANPNEQLLWPVILTGGIGPYAISVDWGDNSPPDVYSSPFAGIVTLKHTYKRAGVYKVIVTATDSKGSRAVLQLVGIANGSGASNVSSKGSATSTATRVVVLWWPALAMLPLIIAAFWVGQRHELYVLRKRLEKSREQEIA